MSGAAVPSGAGVSPVIRRWRIALVIVGVLLTVLGAVVLFQTVSPKQIRGLLLWMLGAVILHDAILSPIVFGVGFLMRKAGKSIPVAVLAIIQGGLVVASVFAIVALPEVYKKFLGTKNDTVLPFDYGTRLLLVWAGTAVATAIVVLVYLARRRSKKA
jgi:hypothetical protein